MSIYFTIPNFLEKKVATYSYKLICTDKGFLFEYYKVFHQIIY